MWIGWTKTDVKKMESALRRVEKCKGDCAHCEKCHLYFADSSDGHNIYMAYGCDALPTDLFDAISNSSRELRKDALETLRFELS